ncbi:MAG: hypothetical protein M3O50_14605 [Myxococcota bacterium]|nr:hypothetical protein [Myxococcota bacterium]
MLFYFVPPLPLFVFALAYIFQRRAAAVRRKAGRDDSRPVRISRAVMHTLLVMYLSVYGQFVPAFVLDRIGAPLNALPSNTAYDAIFLVTFALGFVLPLVAADMFVDTALLALSGVPMDELLRTRLRVRDVARLEIPDLGFLLVVWLAAFALDRSMAWRLAATEGRVTGTIVLVCDFQSWAARTPAPHWFRT